MRRHFVDDWNDGEGGYPPDIDFLPGHVVVASMDPGKGNAAPMLEVYTNKKVRIWHRRTKQWFKQSDMDWDTCVYEADPGI